MGLSLDLFLPRNQGKYIDLRFSDTSDIYKSPEMFRIEPILSHIRLMRKNFQKDLIVEKTQDGQSFTIERKVDPKKVIHFGGHLVVDPERKESIQMASLNLGYVLGINGTVDCYGIDKITDHNKLTFRKIQDRSPHFVVQESQQFSDFYKQCVEEEDFENYYLLIKPDGLLDLFVNGPFCYKIESGSEDRMRWADDHADRCAILKGSSVKKSWQFACTRAALTGALANNISWKESIESVFDPLGQYETNLEKISRDTQDIRYYLFCLTGRFERAIEQKLEDDSTLYNHIQTHLKAALGIETEMEVSDRIIPHLPSPVALAIRRAAREVRIVTDKTSSDAYHAILRAWEASLLWLWIFLNEYTPASPDDFDPPTENSGFRSLGQLPGKIKDLSILLDRKSDQIALQKICYDAERVIQSRHRFAHDSTYDVTPDLARHSFRMLVNDLDQWNELKLWHLVRIKLDKNGILTNKCHDLMGDSSELDLLWVDGLRSAVKGLENTIRHDSGVMVKLTCPLIVKEIGSLEIIESEGSDCAYEVLLPNAFEHDVSEKQDKSEWLGPIGYESLKSGNEFYWNDSILKIREDYLETLEMNDISDDSALGIFEDGFFRWLDGAARKLFNKKSTSETKIRTMCHLFQAIDRTLHAVIRILRRKPKSTILLELEEIDKSFEFKCFRIWRNRFFHQLSNPFRSEKAFHTLFHSFIQLCKVCSVLSRIEVADDPYDDSECMSNLMFGVVSECAFPFIIQDDDDLCWFLTQRTFDNDIIYMDLLGRSRGFRTILMKKLDIPHESIKQDRVQRLYEELLVSSAFLNDQDKIISDNIDDLHRSKIDPNDKPLLY